MDSKVSPPTLYLRLLTCDDQGEERPVWKRIREALVFSKRKLVERVALAENGR